MAKHTICIDTETPSLSGYDMLSEVYGTKKLSPVQKYLNSIKHEVKTGKVLQGKVKKVVKKKTVKSSISAPHVIPFKSAAWHDYMASIEQKYQFQPSLPPPDDQHLKFVSDEEWGGPLTVPSKAPILNVAPAPAPLKPKAKTIKDLASAKAPKDGHPHFLMGVEFEGVIRSDIRSEFEMYMHDLARDIDGNSLIQFGKDFSIKFIPPGFESVEIRTRTLPIDECIVLFEEMLCMFYLASQTKDFRTNKTCGLHLNISEPNVFHGKQASLYYHVLHAFDEENTLDLWDRAGKKHCKPFFGGGIDNTLAAIEARYKELKRYEEKVKRDYGSEWWVNEIDEAKASKYYSVALRDTPTHTSYKGPKVKDHRIEFRCIGNTNYHTRWEDLDASINHMLEIVNNAFYDIQSPRA